MSFTLKVCNYKIGRTLGEGAYGKVKLAVNETIDEPVAFKILNKNKIRKLGMQEKVKREVKAMKKLQHPHIVCLYQVIDTHSDIFLALELAQGGDMYDRICSQGKLSEPESKRLFRQLASALNFSHSKGIAHRDLKLENLLFDKDQNLKVADFGLCNTMQDGASLNTSCGSPDYAAPEILEHVAYDGTKVDAWSSGVILYTMLYGQLPFDGANQSLMFQKVINGEFSFNDGVAQVSDSAKDLIRKLLDPNPISRFSMKQAQNHPWLSELVDSNSYIVNLNNLLVKHQINLKPKRVEDVDQKLLGKLAEIAYRFPLRNMDQTFEQIIATYYRNRHLSALKKELGSKDAFTVLNLCVAYKFLLHRKLVEAANSSEVERKQLTLPVQKHEPTKFYQPRQGELNEVSSSQLMSSKQIARLEKLRQRFTTKKARAPQTYAASVQMPKNQKKLLVQVESKTAQEPAGVVAVIQLICESLKSMGCTWQLATNNKDTNCIDGRVLMAQTPQGTCILIFVHSAVNAQQPGQRTFYAVDFGVKKQQDMCHLEHFEAITDVYNSVIATLDNKQINKDTNSSLDQYFTVSLVGPAQIAHAVAEWTGSEQEDNDSATEAFVQKQLDECEPSTSHSGKPVAVKQNSRSSQNMMSSLETIDTKETLNDQPPSFETQDRLI